MICSEADMLVHPYLDGELIAEERVLVEEHVVVCSRCRELFGHEATFREHLRARLKPRSGRGAIDLVPGVLHQRVLDALDRADARGEGPASPVTQNVRAAARWAAPALGALVTAAAIVLFLRPGVGSLGANVNEASLFEAAIAGHRKNLPPEVGGTRDEIRSWMMNKVSVAVRPPTLHDVRLASHMIQPRLIGARISHLASRDAAQLIYQVGASLVTVYVFDTSGWELAPQARSVRVHLVDGRDVYFSEEAGYAVALYQDRGIGYAVATDLDAHTLQALLEASQHD